MTPAVFGLVLASAGLHALWNALLKRQDGTHSATVAALAVATLVAGLAAALGDQPAFPESPGLAWALCAGACEAGYFLTLAGALSRMPMGLAYSVARGEAILAVWPISALMLGERVSGQSLLGIAVLLVGLIAVGLPAEGARSRGLPWACACGLCIAGYHLCYKLALSAHAAPSALFATSLAVALPLNVLGLGGEGRRELAQRLLRRPAPAIVIGTICTASFLVFLAALGAGGAGAVLTLRNTSIVFAQGMAWAIGERPRRRQVIGALVIALGATILGWPTS